MRFARHKLLWIKCFKCKVCVTNKASFSGFKANIFKRTVFVYWPSHWLTITEVYQGNRTELSGRLIDWSSWTNVCFGQFHANFKTLFSVSLEPFLKSPVLFASLEILWVFKIESKRFALPACHCTLLLIIWLSKLPTLIWCEILGSRAEDPLVEHLEHCSF